MADAITRNCPDAAPMHTTAQRGMCSECYRFYDLIENRLPAHRERAQVHGLRGD